MNRRWLRRPPYRQAYNPSMTLNHADSSHPISLNTAALLTGRSVRTWQRCIAEGQIPRLPDNRQQAAGALIPFEAVRPWIGRQDWLQEEVDLLVQADQGVAHAQAEIGAWFALAALQQAPQSLHSPSGGGGDIIPAFHFLSQAAEQGEADAMHWLGLLYLAGFGEGDGHALALMWIARAAAHGHVIAKVQLEGLLPGGEAVQG